MIKQEIKDKKIAVIGLGISNMPLIDFLSGLEPGAVDVFDRNDSEETVSKVNKLKEKGLINESYLGQDYLKHLAGNYDIIFKTPVVRFDTPELQKASEMGAAVTSEIEMLLKYCPAKVYGVTGSDGKTTTTTLIHLLLTEALRLKKSDGKVWIGGNIGIPLLSHLPEMKKNDIVVLELSSFQLMGIKYSPDVSVITNISPNHLDVHKSYGEYIDAKASVFRFQKPGSVTVLNNDNEVTRKLKKDCRFKVRLFSYNEKVKNGAWFDGKSIMYSRDGESVRLVGRDEIIILGKHNIENYMTAATAVSDEFSGLPEAEFSKAVRKIASSFRGVAHRMQLVRELDGVRYYNSSIDSSPNRTINALSVFNNKEVVLIAGGKDKNIPYDDLGPHIARAVRVLILTGPTAEKIEASVLDAYKKNGTECDIRIIHCPDYEEAVKAAFDNAEQGNAVVLSPASTSFDMFKNFEERGNTFEALVKKL